jgi:hypothetical protein
VRICVEALSTGRIFDDLRLDDCRDVRRLLVVPANFEPVDISVSRLICRTEFDIMLTIATS